MVLHVHLVPHSHTDPGWLNTYTGYFGAVRGILNSVVEALDRHPNRTFAWAETCFFARWFAELSDDKRALVHRLVTTRQLEFVGGGWVQHDEALPTVGAMVDQLAEGHGWLRRTFNLQPEIGWQIDPFGHTAVSAAVHARAGFRGLVINRIHHRIKQQWRHGRRLEFRWQLPTRGGGGGGGGGNASARPGLLTHVLHTHYSSPRGFDKRIVDGYGPAKAEALAKELRKRAECYRTNQALGPPPSSSCSFSSSIFPSSSSSSSSSSCCCSSSPLGRILDVGACMTTREHPDEESAQSAALHAWRCA